ncbi:MAG: hypothetical protein U5K55_03810 [Aliarcobacter sp.]|nr:hypothetical protein [Aliarcobacter sp.]
MLFSFLNGDSKIPEYAGFYSAMVGSVLTLIITMFVAVPYWSYDSNLS